MRILSRRNRVGAGLVAAVVLATASCSSAGSGTSPDTAVFAEQAGNAPNYIFPFVNATYNTVPNVRQLQYLLYRPLYWFGNGSSIEVNYALSLADPPSWNKSDDAVTIHLKPYQWSDGSELSPRDVAFWIGLARSEKQNSAYYIPGQFPDNVKAVTYDDAADTVTLNLTQPVSPDWFLYSALSQITPLPLAWDITGPGAKGHCSSESAGQQAASCPAVYRYLTAQASDQASYASNPLWKVVDGPFRLSEYSPSGNMTFVPNPRYSGPVKPTIKTLQYLAFTNDTAEYNSLRSGNNISVGYIPLEDLPGKAASAQVGSNPLSPAYKLYPQSLWGFYYLLLNFNNPKVGPLLHQLYIRQALQSVIDQPLYIAHAQKGYGFEQYGPVPTVPANPFIDPGSAASPLTFSISRARQLLISHGWSISGSAVATCAHPGTGNGECGAEIAAGTHLAFTLLNFTDPVEEQETQQLASDAAEAGISVQVTNLPPKQLVAETAQCAPSSPACNWQISNYGSNDYPSGFPDGAQTFQAGAGLNVGSYSDPEMNALIKATMDGSLSAFASYEQYAAEQVPVLWMPSQYLNVAEVSAKLTGAAPLSPLGNINPENWRFAS